MFPGHSAWVIVASLIVWGVLIVRHRDLSWKGISATRTARYWHGWWWTAIAGGLLPCLLLVVTSGGLSLSALARGDHDRVFTVAERTGVALFRGMPYAFANLVPWMLFYSLTHPAFILHPRVTPIISRRKAGLYGTLIWVLIVDFYFLFRLWADYLHGGDLSLLDGQMADLELFAVAGGPVAYFVARCARVFIRSTFFGNRPG